jgi:PAS domain-containing protein
MSKSLQMQDFHWLMDILQNIDVGLVVLDKNYRVQLWNAFMENHSGIGPQSAQDKKIHELFPDIEQKWLEHKFEPVFFLKTQAFILHQQRPYLFRFSNAKVISGLAPFMYQNVSIIPILDINREVSHICLIVYDVTALAMAEKATNTPLEN